MPIIPRFASVQDPNTPPNVDFSQGIMQSALAGAQLRRMGVEEKQAEAEGKRADARLGVQQDTLAFRKQAYQDSRDAQSEQAAVTGFFSGQSGLPADQAGPPSPFEAQELEARGAQAFRGSLKTPEAQRLFDEQYAGYLENRRQEIRLQGMQAELQDTLAGFARMPEASKPYEGSIEKLALQLNEIGNPNLDPRLSHEATMAWTQELGRIKDGVAKEQKTLEDIEATSQFLVQRAANLPPGHPDRSRYQDLNSALAFSRNPAKTMEAMYAIDQGHVLDEPSGRWVKPEVAARLSDTRAQRKAIEDRIKAKADAGESPDWGTVVNLGKFIHESQFYTDKETGRPEPIDPTRVTLNPVESFALAFAQLHPEAFAARIAESKEMQDAIDAEGQSGPTGGSPTTGGTQPTVQGGATPTTAPAKKLEPVADLESRLARWKRAGIVPDEQVSALEQEIAGRKASEVSASKLAQKYGGENTVLLEIRRRKAERAGSAEAQEIKNYIESDATARGDELRRLMGLDAAALSDMLDSAESSERMGAIKERRGYSGTRG